MVEGMSAMFEDLADISVELSCASSACPIGQYGKCEAFGSYYSCEVDVCLGCPPGKYSTRAGSVSISDCISCVAGKYSNTSGSTSCSICENGHFTSDSSSDSDGNGVSSGATFCVVCPAGKYQESNESYYCDDCLAGYISSEGSNECTACDAGKYASSPGTSECTSCESGKRATSLVAAEGCTKCRSNFYSWEGSTNCSKC